ncbi:DUF4192 domain-containing protein [Streptomyces viridochromogenes]|uniref:DUF4192 domain-containing protein n=1 Tax=Streptomyces viridochromogenes TaxID=1938 RepID=UPI00069EB20B|nr:DUF4192 domain-containing protein [Streptomyces viridochromogenes]KOG07622.1 hypothetical protein ADK35_43435 [Streptomyces viridochromogenes]KOG12763.1 hypothetical protein ADK36_34455 [Streptomyces viridochromogenes]
MTNHSEVTGSPENDDNTGGEHYCAPGATDATDKPEMYDAQLGPDEDGGHTGRAGHAAHAGQAELARHLEQLDCTTHEAHLPEHQVTLRTPAELADALPYLLGYRPEDSIVLVALHDRAGRGRFGGRARLGIPASKDDWDSAARQLTHGLVRGGERRGVRPEQMVAFLCQEPTDGETGRQVMERLRPLAQKMRVACGSLDVPVIEALCISDGRFWSYCCDRVECCPPEGRTMGLPGTSVLAAAATYAGVQVRGTLRELRARLQPLETAAALEQEAALDTVGMELVPRIVDDASRAGVAEQTLDLAERLRCRFAAAPLPPGTLTADLRDDELLGHDEAARLILGLQDRATRDRAAEWMEGDEAGPALRLWRALARRCVGPYSEHAAAPLTLVGWVAWSTGDDLEAREALAMALGADRDYLFARLLHQACNEGLDPESIRRCLRAEREGRERTGAAALDKPEDVEQQVRDEGEESVRGEAERPVPGKAVESAPLSETGDRRTSRRRAGSAGSLPRSASGTGRERGTSVPRPRASARTRPGVPRPGGTVPRSSKETASRTSKKGAARRDGSRPDGVRPGSDGGEGHA